MNAEVRSTHGPRINEVSERRDFGVTDRLGRRIGCRVVLYEIDYTPAAADARGYYRVEPGHYYAMVTSATRAEAHYGASQPERRFASAEEREQALQAYYRDAEKRARKTAAKADRT